MPVDVATVKKLFLAVLEMSASERAAYLETACAGDTALRHQLEAMLQSHEMSGELLPRSPAEMLADGAATEADATAAWARPREASATLSERAGAEPGGLPFLTPSTKPGHLGRLGHYEVQEVIGKGGFGIVLRAFDEKLHRVVAIKVLAPAYATVGSARERFIREARAAAAVKNEHVVAIYNVQDEEQPPYLVMELIDGVTLQEKLDKKGPLSVKEILRIGMQTAEGLAAAHKQGLVHRDVKPANILLENGVERVKLTDFGLARAVDDASLSQSGTVAGTPMYMSPEQAEGLAVDHRSDLFSLGSVLYAICTGHPPFRASGTMAVLKRVIDDAPRPLREVNPEIPDWLEAIIAKLHAKKPEGRVQTAREVAELLGQYLAHVQQPGSVPAPPGMPAAAPASAAPVPAGRFWWLVSRVILFGACCGILVGYFAIALGIIFLPGYWLGYYSIRTALAGAAAVAALSGIVDAARADRQRRLALMTVSLFLAGVVLVLGFAPAFFDSAPWPWAARAQHGIGDHDTRFRPVFSGPGWRRLYDGKSYAGWRSLGNSKVGGGEIVLFHGGAVETKEELPRNFHLRMEVKLVRGHGTVRIHTPGGGETLDGWFLRFSEAPHAPGLLASEVGNAFGNAGVSSKWEGWARLGEWFHLEIITVDRRTDLRVNGARYEYLHKLFLPAAGVLRLWNNGFGDSEIAFRNIEVKDLTSPQGPPPLAVAPFDATQAKKHQEAWAKHLGVPVEVENSVGMKLRLIPPGKFLMGASAQDLDIGLNEKPQHEVTLTKPFYAGVHEVTVGQFKAFVNELNYKTDAEQGAGAYGFPGGSPPTMTKDAATNWQNTGFTQTDNHPVVCVTLNDAKAFCVWLSKKEGQTYAVLSEAQWEYCCRAGTQTPFSFGSDILLLGRHAWYDGNSKLTTHPVGEKAANAWGLFDMHGNAEEWTTDWIGWYQKGPQQDPTGPASGTRHSYRGGSWFAWPRFCRSSWRQVGSGTDNAEANCGFRVALVGDLKPKTPAAETSWVQLFNGKDMIGWKTLPGEPSGWKVEAGQLVGRSLPSSYLFSESGRYENFHLRAEVKVNATGDSGLFFRTRFEKLPNDAPPSYEADLSFRRGSPSSPIGSLWLEGKRIQRAAQSWAVPDQWFTLEVIARGPRVQVLVNGKTVCDYTDPNHMHRRGHIALQAVSENETASTVVHFRKIEIKELPPVGAG